MVSLGFDQLSRPDATRNVAMAFAHTGSSLPKWLGVMTQSAGNTHQLAVTADGEKRVILGSIPMSGAFSVLRDVQHSSFRREPPYQDFVFQDDHRTYLASPSGDVRLDAVPGSLLRIPLAINNLQTSLVLAAQPKPKVIAAMKSFAALGIVSNVVALQPITDTPAAVQISPRAMPALSKGTSSALLQHLPAGALVDLFNLKGLRFQSLVHPHVCAFKDALTKGGLPGLFDPAVQSLNGDPGARNSRPAVPSRHHRGDQSGDAALRARR
jgi:hypothetical protein